MKNKTKRRVCFLLLSILALLLVAAAVYLGSYYPADAEALAVLEHPAPSVRVVRTQRRIDFVPASYDTALIFYPGGKVQFEAYAPLLERLAARGVLCVLLKMPGNLAVLAPNAADGVRSDYPSVGRWYVGGHSLGGVIAATYLEKHSADYEGLILLASYTTADLSNDSLRILSVYGSEDGVLDRARLEAAKALLPADAEEQILAGGCHAYFGRYGEQKGDGEAALSPDEQIDETADLVTAFLKDNKTAEKAA